MTGIELCETLCQHADYQHIPVILISAVGGTLSTVTCPCAARLVKPIDITTLIITVERVLQRTAQQ
jgi:DNA-binding response OmpR family regulator